MNPSTPHTPPSLARRLLRRYCAAAWAEEVEGDLAEQFAEQVARYGVRRARRRYHWDVLRYLAYPYIRRGHPYYPSSPSPPSILEEIMFKNYFKVALRSLQRAPGYTVINVTGLAVGMACCLLIFMLVRHEWSFDAFHAEADRIHRVLILETTPEGELDYHNLIPPPMGPALDAELSGIEHLTRVISGGVGVSHEGQQFREQIYLVDSTFFDVFSFGLLAGDPATALDDPQHLIVTEEMALKYFGSLAAPDDALGRTLTLIANNQPFDFTVSAVAAAPPPTSSFQFDLIGSFHQYEARNIMVGANDWGGRNSLYVLLEPDQDPAAFEAALIPFTADKFADRIERRREGDYIADGPDAFRLVLQPLLRMHLEPETGHNYEGAAHNPLYSYILGGIGLLVLLIACINFMTLSLGRSAGRAREVGMRKVMGAYRLQLMKQFWGESLLLAALGLTLGLALASLALPAFNALTGQTLTLGQFFDAGSVAALLGLLAVVALVAGGYPAAVLSRFQPATVLKGNVRTRGKSGFTRSLVVVQYTLSIALIVSTLIMYRQLDYLLNKDLGFEGDQVVAVQTGGLTDAQERAILGTFRSELASDPRVTGIVGTGYAFTQSYDTYSWVDNTGRPFLTHMIGADYDYVDLLDMEVIAGRNFSRDFPTDSTQSVLVNEAFVRKHEIADPIGFRLTGIDGFFGEIDPTIIGVVRDFNFRSLHDEVAPAMLNMHPDYYMGMNAVLIEIRPEDTAGTLAQIEAVWGTVIPERTLQASFLDDDMDAQYQAEQRWSRIVAYSSIFAILIACLGLFGLATLSVSRRTKEIGIRKVLGASVPGLALLVTREFATLVALAMVVAWPLAYFGMERWLDTFAYRTAIPWWSFFLAGLLGLGIALLTVAWHAIRAALTDPASSLRYE